MNRREFFKTGLEGIVLAKTLPTLSAGENSIRSDSDLDSMAEKYFPLYVDNSWTYVKSDDDSTKTFTIIGTEEINGNIYYKFDDYFGAPWMYEVTEGREVLFRHDTNRVLMWDSWWYSVHGEEVCRYDFSDREYWSGGGLGYCRLKQANVICNVPAGEFSDCINFQFLACECGPNCYGFGEYLAPNVGNVKYVNPGGGCIGAPDDVEGSGDTYELQEYKIKETTSVEKEKPTEFSLQNYPNPFNSSTTIKYQLPENTNVSLDVYNISGQKIKTLVDKVQNKGLYQVKFDANDLSSGIYFYTLITQDTIKTQKMLLVK